MYWKVSAIMFLAMVAATVFIFYGELPWRYEVRHVRVSAEDHARNVKFMTGSPYPLSGFSTGEPHPVSGFHSNPAHTLAGDRPAREERSTVRLSGVDSPGIRLHIENDNFNLAAAELDRVLGRVPGHLDTEELLGRVSLEREAAIERHLHKGIVYFLSEEMESAIKLWDAVLELDPGNRSALDYKERAETVLERLEEIKARSGGSTAD